MAEAKPDAPSDVALILAELEAGGGLSLTAAGRLFPAHRGRGTVGPSTIFRWVMKGIKLRGGEVVKLSAARAGSRWLTTRGAVARFVATLTAAADPASAPSLRPPAQRQRAADRADAELEQGGW